MEKPLTEQLFLCYNTFTAEREPFAESFLHRKEHLFTCVSTLRKGEHFMTEEIRRDFLLRFARQYDLPGSAAAAGITRQQAYQLLRDPAARQMVDEQAARRRSGEILARIAREYERIAFSDEEEIKVGDRLRAMEQLRLLSSADSPAGAAPALNIICRYV